MQVLTNCSTLQSSYLCSISNSEGNFKGFNTELCFPFAQSDNKYQPLVSLEVAVHCRTIIVNVSLQGCHTATQLPSPVSQCSNFKLHCFGIIFIHEIFYWRRNFSLFLFSKSSSLENVIFWNLFPHCSLSRKGGGFCNFYVESLI